MEELLLTYNERPFVSEQYRTGLDRIGERADAMAAAELPDDLRALIETLGQDSVRRLSVILLTMMLKLERDPVRAPEVARDVAALCEDLLLSGDYGAAVMVTRALADQATDASSVSSEGCRVALDVLAETPAFVRRALWRRPTPKPAVPCCVSGPGHDRRAAEAGDVDPLTPGGAGRATSSGSSATGRSARLAPLVASPHCAPGGTRPSSSARQSAEAVPPAAPARRRSRQSQAAVRRSRTSTTRRPRGACDGAARRVRRSAASGRVGARRRARPRRCAVLIRILAEASARTGSPDRARDAQGDRRHRRRWAVRGGERCAAGVARRRKLRAVKQASLERCGGSRPPPWRHHRAG